MGLTIGNVESTKGWHMTHANGDTVALAGEADHVNVQIVADNKAVVIHREER